jgi:hypothetical protein
MDLHSIAFACKIRYKMKKIFLIIFVFLFGIAVNGQEQILKNQLRVGGEIVFYGTGDNIGRGISIEYNRNIFNRLFVLLNLYSTSAYDKVDYSYDNSNDLGFGIGGRIYPLNIIVLKRLYFDIGLSVHDFTRIYGNKNTYINSDYLVYNNQKLFGFSACMGYDLISTEKFIIGSRLKMITSINEGPFSCDGWQLGFIVGLKF